MSRLQQLRGPALHGITLQGQVQIAAIGGQDRPGSGDGPAGPAGVLHRMLAGVGQHQLHPGGPQAGEGLHPVVGGVSMM